MAMNTLAALGAGIVRKQALLGRTTNLNPGLANTVIQGCDRYQAGVPTAASVPTPGMSGVSLTGPTGDIPFPAPGAGDVRVVNFVGVGGSASNGFPVLVDRLWHSSGISPTTLTAQTVNSVAWPARDNNNSTNGEGVFIAVEIFTAVGAGTPTITISYTNSDGTAGRTGTNILATIASSGVGVWYVIGLEGADKGVRSVQSVTLSATWTSGTLGLVAFRPLFMGMTDTSFFLNNRQNVQDAIHMAMPKLHPETFLSRCRGGGPNNTGGTTQGYITFATG